jgi:DNA-binding LacI/PurR family transcriptional regulator
VLDTDGKVRGRWGGRQGGRQTTMRDIAEATGLSQSTVSRVLSGAPSPVTIGDVTRERVMDVARQLGYSPNPLARALRGARTMLLGVIVREITDLFMAGAVDAISIEAAGHDYNIVLGHAHSRADEAIALHAVLETRHCDALLLLGDMGDQPRLLDDLRDAHIPVVALWQGAALDGIETINVDNAAGVGAALDHLTDLGHRRIGLIAGGQLGDIQRRRSAFLDHIRPSAGDASDMVADVDSNDPDAGARGLDILMGLPDPPSAVLTTTDALAIGALHAADARGLKVPHDLSIVGFDDIFLARFTVPPLTTVHMPTSEMAALAVRVAIGETAADDGHRGRDHVVPPSLVIRESTAALSR